MLLVALPLGPLNIVLPSTRPTRPPVCVSLTSTGSPLSACVSPTARSLTIQTELTQMLLATALAIPPTHGTFLTRLILSATQLSTAQASPTPTPPTPNLAQHHALATKATNGPLVPALAALSVHPQLQTSTALRPTQILLVYAILSSTGLVRIRPVSSSALALLTSTRQEQ